MKYLRAITMCIAFTPDCGYDNSTIILIGDVYCLYKKFFQSLGRGDYLCPLLASVCQVRKIPFEEKKILFLSFGQGVYIFEESLKQFKIFLEMCVVLASIVSTEGNAKLLTVM